MDSEINLPPRSLMNMLCEAYKSDAPVTTLRNLLQPYHITYEQLQGVMTTVFWPARLSANEAHPFYVTARKLTEYQHNTDTLAKREYFNKRFIYVATAVCHAWYAWQREHDYKFVLHRDPHFVAYQCPGMRAPYVWFSFDPFGMPHVFAAHEGMPPLEIQLFRSTQVGDMLPLTLRFFVVPPAPAGPGERQRETPSPPASPPKALLAGGTGESEVPPAPEVPFCPPRPSAVGGKEGAAGAPQSVSKLQFHVHNQQFLKLCTSPSDTRTYVMFISEDLMLTRCLMVSPTTDNAWSIPVVMHKYE